MAKTAYDVAISDGSSDVCASDLVDGGVHVGEGALDVDLYLLGADELGDHRPARLAGRPQPDRPADVAFLEGSMAARRDGDPAAGGGRGLQRRGRLAILVERSEERRVGKECVSTCRSRWSKSP